MGAEPRSLRRQRRGNCGRNIRGSCPAPSEQGPADSASSRTQSRGPACDRVDSTESRPGCIVTGLPPVQPSRADRRAGPTVASCNVLPPVKACRRLGVFFVTISNVSNKYSYCTTDNLAISVKVFLCHQSQLEPGSRSESERTAGPARLGLPGPGNRIFHRAADSD